MRSISLLKFITSVILLFIITIKLSHAQDTISPPNQNGPTKVYISMVVNTISSIDAVNQTIKAEVLIKVKWNDPRLAHSSSGRLIKSLDLIWDPWLVFTNKLSASKSLGDVASVMSDGTVIYMQSTYGEFIQNYQFREFPFDSQTFYVRLAAIGLAAHEIELIYEDSPVNLNSLKLPDWTFTNFYTQNSPFQYTGEKSPVPSIALFYEAKREGGFYILVFVIPLVLIIIMSWMAFWLDPSLGSSQVSIATTSMLTLIAYRFVVIGNLPKISYMTKMDVFVLGSSILIFLTLMEAALTASSYAKGKKDVSIKMDKTSRWVFPLLYVILAIIAYNF